MKKIILVCIAATITLFSCLDTEEKITINEDNSGTYMLTIDMSGMMDQLKTFAPDAADKLNEDKDTTIRFKSFTDSATTLTADEKSILENASMHLLMKSETGDMKMEATIPFKDLQQLLYIKQHMGDLLSKIKPDGNMLDEMSKDGDANADAMNLPGMSNGSGLLFNPGASAYSFNIEKNKISNTLTDKSAFSNLISSDSSMQMIKQLAPLMGDINYKTVFVLPRPVKKFSGGSASVLSDDKKTLTFTNSITNVLDKPESMEYSVEY